MVHDAPVGLLGQALVKAAVARLHMEDGDMQALGGDGGQAGVGVSQNQQSVWLHLHHELIAPGDDVADALPQIGSHGVQIVVRSTQAQILKKDLIEGIVVVLTGVDQNLIKILIASFDRSRQPDDLRPGADDSHELELCHNINLSSA